VKVGTKVEMKDYYRVLWKVGMLVVLKVSLQVCIVVALRVVKLAVRKDIKEEEMMVERTEITITEY